MKISPVAIILIIVILCALTAGCSSLNDNERDKPDGTVSPTITPVPTPVPDVTTPSAKNTDSSGKIPAPTYVPIKEINKHFLTIAFSEYNGVVLRQERKTPISVSLFGNVTKEDVVVVEQFIRDFNRVSKTQKLYGNIKYGEDADLWINIFHEPELHSLEKDFKGNDQVQYVHYETLFSDTILYSVDFSGQVYVNGDLPREKRNHYIIRALMSFMGITGEATDEDSFFYPGNTEQANLTDSDWKAVMILYGPSMKYNMTMSDAKNRLYWT